MSCLSGIVTRMGSKMFFLFYKKYYQYNQVISCDISVFGELLQYVYCTITGGFRGDKRDSIPKTVTNCSEYLENNLAFSSRFQYLRHYSPFILPFLTDV